MPLCATRSIHFLNAYLSAQAVAILLEYCLSDLDPSGPAALKQLPGLPLCLLADESLHTFRAASQPSLYICTADQAELLHKAGHLLLHQRVRCSMVQTQNRC